MTEGKEKKKKSAAAPEAQRPVPGTVGEILRAARIQKGLGLEEISSAINIRVGQLRAIEEGNIGALPGMTYALGFVKSYASYLKLSSAEIVQKFKAEHGAQQGQQAQVLHMPEPLPEGPKANFALVGAAGFVVILGFIAWAVFSGGGPETAQEGGIPDAPAVGTVTGLKPAPPVVVASKEEPPPESSLAGTSLLGGAPPAKAPEAAPAPAEQAPPAEQAAAVAEPAQATAAPEAAAAEAEPAAPLLFPTRPDREGMRRAALAAQQQAEQQKAGDGETPPPVINIKRGKGRIVFVPTQASWIELRDAEGETVVKKVLRPGDQFYVPDQPGLKLITTNAGGLDVYVDGAKVQPLGRSGEIVRGLQMNPDALKVTRVKARDR